MALKKNLPLLAAVALSAFAETASATPSTFTFYGPESVKMEYTVDGISFESSDSSNIFGVYQFDYDTGIGFYLTTDDPILGTQEFSFHFDEDVLFLGYMVEGTWNTAGTESFSLTGGLISSSGNSLLNIGVNNMPEPLALEANQDYHFEITNFGGSASVLFTGFVVEAVPEPSSIILLGAGAVGAAFLGYRRRKA